MTQICEIILSNRGGIKIDKNRYDLYYWYCILLNF